MKIMVVEDDAALREIYSIRIAAEGYEIATAGDGEEALAVAVREKPDLILSDVMMPKISGFDMLDILRSTPETANIKVVMMTALSSDDQRERGERLGADRYLVKSQVGIEDVVNVIHEVLGDRAENSTPSNNDNSQSQTEPQSPVAKPQVAASQAMYQPQPPVVSPTTPLAPQPNPVPQAANGSNPTQ
jgi:DNA-binding response OmpR family regulator